MDLYSELDAFDGKHTDGLESLAERLPLDTPTVDRLCEISEEGEPRLQTAATWVLKRLGERGHTFSEEHQDILLGLLDQIPHWEARLHLLQMLPRFTIPARRKKSLHAVLLRQCADANKFVRAWSYNGLAILADRFDALRDDTRTRLDDAEREEAASIRARIRNARKGRDWLQ